MTAPPIQDQLLTGRVLGLVVRELGLLQTPPLDATFESLNADSLDMVTVVMHVEDAFDVSIDDAALNPVRTVGQLVETVRAKVEARG